MLLIIQMFSDNIFNFGYAQVKNPIDTIFIRLETTLYEKRRQMKYNEYYYNKTWIDIFLILNKIQK